MRDATQPTELLLPFDCIPYHGPEKCWREKVVELLWLDRGQSHPELAWPTATCATPMCLYLSHLAWRSPKTLKYPPGVCVYCGMPADTKDHLLPRTWTGEAVRKHVLTVPACRQCNSTINDRYLPSITARRKHAHEYIFRKSANLLQMPEWTPEDLAVMGKTLRSTVERGLFDRKLARARLAWPEDRDYDLRVMQHSGIENPYELGLLDRPVRPATPRAPLTPRPLPEESPIGVTPMVPAYDPTITVCSKCLRACCWQGEFMCEDAHGASTQLRHISTLIRHPKNDEHPDWWNRDLDVGHRRLLTATDLRKLGITNPELLELSP